MKAALVAPKFDVAGRLVTVENTGEGNVNDTYLAVFRTTFSKERFILQRINTRVFPRPVYTMENMRRVTEHVHRRLQEEGAFSDRIWQLPRIIRAKDGKDFVVDGDGDYWRAISRSIEPHHGRSCGNGLDFVRLILDVRLLPRDWRVLWLTDGPLCYKICESPDQ